MLAIGGLFVGGAQLISLAPQSASDAGASTEALDSPMMSEAGDGTVRDEMKRAPAEKINLCTAPVAMVVPSATGLVLSVDFPDAAAGTSRVDGVVVMTNTGGETITGYTAASPAITLAQNGTVIWHSNGPTIQLARDVALAPGESIEYAASFTPVVCDVEDDVAESFRTDLPSAPAGQYQVSAAIDLMGERDADLITGDAQTVTLN